MKNKLVLIDGNSILYRSFYALPLLTTKDGRYTNAVYGFANTIIKAIQDIKPTHICVAFDVSKHTFRNEIYAEYKATRKPMPDELRSQIEPVKKMLELMNIKVLEKQGLEADDILGTISKRFEDTEVIIITGDRDTLQLISDTTKIYFTKKGISDIKLMDINALHEEYGIEPYAIVDLKALQGDTADNIPGVPGIGPKSALDLIQKYKTLDGVYKNVFDQKPGLVQKLMTGRDSAYMSYKLAKINCEVDIACELNDCVYDYPFSSGVYNFMQDYNFNTLLKKAELFNLEGQDEYYPDVKVEVVDTKEKLQKVIKSVEKTGYFSVVYDNNRKLHIAIKDTEWVLFGFDDLFALAQGMADSLSNLKVLFENANIRKIFFDSKAFRYELKNSNIEIKGKIEDVSIMHHLVHGLSVKSIEDVFGVSKSFEEKPALHLLNEYNKLLISLKDLAMDDLYYDLELPLSTVLYDMERVGFKVDVSRVEELGNQYKQELDKLVNEIYKLAGEEFNINSPKKLSEILFDKLSLPHNKKKSTSADVLTEIEGTHPIVSLILRYRKVTKLNSTYIEGLKPHIDSNNVVHTSFKQTITATGRLSSVEPNLQNIPIRSDESREVRSIYIASSPNHILIDADYSQIELRLLAHLSGDPDFVEAFNTGFDIHAQTASQIFGVLKENVTSEMRRMAKIVNFGIIYGISDFGLSSDLGCSVREAKAFIENFYLKHPAVKEYMDNAIKEARETGYQKTILGRMRKMVDINSTNYMIRSRAERASQNMPLQGSAADIIKLAMLNVWKELKAGGYKAKLIMQVHDELIIDCPIEEKDNVVELVRHSMNTAYQLKVPLTSDVVCSYRWSDGH